MAMAHVSAELNNENLETFSVVWLDTAVNETEKLQAQQQIRTAIHHLKTFVNVDESEKHILSVHKDDRIVLIVGSNLGRILVPRIHQLRQVWSIYVFSMNKRNEEWIKHHSKINGVTEELDELVALILSIQERPKPQRILDEPFSFDIFDTKAGNGQSSTELNGQFVHSQLLINCLFRMRPSSKDKNEFLSYIKKAYTFNKSNMDIIREFERDYSPDQALRWYTRPCFLYKLLNKALRVQNVELLYLIRFFIRDIGQQLEEYKMTSPIDVYRYQLISKEELGKLKNSIGQLISMNSFFSTSRDRQLAFSILNTKDPSNKDSELVIFEIHADPRLDRIKAFADINPFSHIPDEEEVLMMLGSIFRLVSIHPHGQGWIIRMALCSENDHDLKPIIDQIKHEVFGDDKATSNAGTYGHVLSLMGKVKEAEKYFNRALSELSPGDENIDSLYRNLGILAGEKGDYDTSLELGQKALEMKLCRLKPDDPRIADEIFNMSSTYLNNHDYKKALESCNEALAMYKKVFSDEDLKVGFCYMNLGSVYNEMKKHAEAFDYYQKTLLIFEKHLHTNHYRLGELHTNIGTTHCTLGHLELALEHFNRALEIFEKSSPSQHSNFAHAYYGIGCVYLKKNMLRESLSYFQKAHDIFLKELSATHPSVLAVERNIQHIKQCIKE